MNYRNQPFNRAPRQQLARLDEQDIDLPKSPEAPVNNEFHWIIVVSPLMGFMAMAVFYVARGGITSPVTLLPLALLAGVSIASAVLLQRWRTGNMKTLYRTRQQEYERSLDTRKARLQATHDALLASLDWTYPAPKQQLNKGLHPDVSLWERRSSDPDFLSYRAGTGTIGMPLKWRVASEELERHPQAANVMERYRRMTNAPMVFSLADDGSTALVGRRAQVLSASYAIIGQLALTHAPQDLHIALIAPSSSLVDWEWATWLPHTRQNEQLPCAFTSETTRNLLGYLGQWLDVRRETQTSRPHLLLVVDEPQWIDTDSAFTQLLQMAAQVGASVLCVASAYEHVPGDCQTLLYVNADGSFRYQRGEGQWQGEHADALTLAEISGVARALAPIVMNEPGAAGRVPARVDLLDLYGVRTVGELASQLSQRWNQPLEGRLPKPVPIGRESLATDAFLMLDEERHGPHGVLAGTTGSGKSELLQSLVCGLAIEHPPSQVTLLLIDFKGGSTFNPFRNLPHTVGFVTNLDPLEVRRVLEALKSEMEWRQQFLKVVGARDIFQFHRLYAKNTKETLPHLVIIVDEFAQLARELPEFLSELVKTVQVGRSLGLHLILGTQSPMDVITDEMNANLQFRICLRVQNVDASRAMLRRPDAAYLPVGRPGRGYLQVGERALFKQFQSAYSGAPYREAVNPRESQVLELVRPTGEIVNLLDSTQTGETQETITVAMAVSDAISTHFRQKRLPAPRSLLLPSLPTMVGLSRLHAELRGGCDGYRWLPAQDGEGHMIPVGSAPIGLVDDLSTRTQYPLWIHLNQNSADDNYDGHLLVVGAPSTGKTTLLRTLALSLGALHSPDDLHLYFLSFTGNGLQVVSQLPHAAEMVNGVQSERVRRLFGRLMTTLEERQSNNKKPHPHVILFVDQYEQFRDSCRDTHGTDLERLINEGRGVNIFVVLVLSTIHALPDRLRAVIQQRIAFQQSNSADYVLTVGRLQTTQQATLPTGRAYVNASVPLLAQIGLPTLNPAIALNESSVTKALPATVEALQDAYRRMHLGATIDLIRWQAPIPLNELPTRLSFGSLPTPDLNANTLKTPLGARDDDSLSVFELDWWNEGVHFVVVGPPASGKTSLLHLATLSAAQQLPPSRLRFLLVDFNQRSLRPLATLKHVVARVTDVAELKEQLVYLNADLAANHDLGEQAPITVLIVDDYDLVADVLASDYEVLQQLRHVVRFYNDSPFHVWVGGYLERVGDPFIKQLLLRRSGFGLMQRDYLQRLNVRTAQLSADTMPVGRAFVPRIGGVDVVQLALIEDTQAVINYLNDDLWIDEDAAQWTAAFAAHPTVELSSQSLRHSENIEIDTDGLIDDLMNDLRGGGE